MVRVAVREQQGRQPSACALDRFDEGLDTLPDVLRTDEDRVRGPGTRDDVTGETVPFPELRIGRADLVKTLNSSAESSLPARHPPSSVSVPPICLTLPPDRDAVIDRWVAAGAV